MDYNEQNKKLDELFKNFKELTNTLIKEGPSLDATTFSLRLIEVHGTYIELFSEIDKTVWWLVENCNLKKDSNVRSDFEVTLQNFLRLTEIYYKSFVTAIKETNVSSNPEPSPLSYKNVQKYFSTFSSTEIAEKTKHAFIQLGIDVSAYNERFDKSKIEIREKEIQMEKDKKEAEEQLKAKVAEQLAKAKAAELQAKLRAEAAALKRVAKRRTISIIVGFACIAIVIPILLIKKPPYDQFLQVCLQILFAIGIGGISAALIGSFRWRLLQSTPIDLVGGLGVAIYLLTTGVKPWVPIPPNPEFSANVELRYKADENVSGVPSVDNVQLKFDGKNRPGDYIPQSGIYEWANIPIVFKDSSLELTLTSKKWRFEGNRKTIPYRIKEGANVLSVVKDTINNRIFGVVTYIVAPRKKKPDVVIYLAEDPAIKAVPDEFGKWSLELPETIDAGLAKIVVQRNGTVYRKPTLYSAGVSIPIQIPY
jgi:hypothetical protein